jgi:hypothetical protein
MGAKGRNLGQLGWAGCGPGGGNLAPGPLGSVAGGPDRRRGWLLCLSPVPAAGGHAKPGYALGNKSPAGRGVRSAGGCQDVGAGPRPPPAGAGPQLGPKTEDRSPGPGPGARGGSWWAPSPQARCGGRRGARRPAMLVTYFLFDLIITYNIRG